MIGKFNMISMDGIDIVSSQGEEIKGLYNRLVEGISVCKYQILYNWYFAKVLIPPTTVELILEDNVVSINGFISIGSDDILHVYSLESSVVINPLVVNGNGSYSVPDGVDGFNPVTVEVIPNIQPLSCTENGVYRIPEGVDGFNPVTVGVVQNAIILNQPPTSDIGVDGQYCIVETYSNVYDFAFTLRTLGRGTDYNFSYWGTNGIVFVFEDTEGNEVDSSTLASKHGWWAQGSSVFQSQDGIVSGSLSTYYEHSGKPGYFKVQFEIPSGYKIKKIKVAVRINSSYQDFWRTFSLDQWIGDYQSVLNILSEENLVWGDWNSSGFTEFVLTQPVEPIQLAETHLYKKASGNWMLIN